MCEKSFVVRCVVHANVRIIGWCLASVSRCGLLTLLDTLHAHYANRARMESKINLAQVSPVNYKVTAALVNQFVVSTTQFLNRFATRCDRKLQQVGSNMHRIEVIPSALSRQ